MSRTNPRAAMLLSELAAAAGAAVAGGDTEVSGLATDSRRVDAGDLFVAIPGLTRNGEDFVPEALRRGAAAVCARSPIAGVPTLVTPEPRVALAHLAAAFHGYPARALRVLGITGSLGKTSTALLLEQALSRGGEPVGVIGSLGLRFAGEVVHTRMTTPEAPAIHSALAEMRQQGARSVVMEVTSHSLRLERVAGLRLALGVITNLVPDEHLEFHSSPEDYLRTKARFLDLLEPEAPLVANADDEHIPRLLQQRARSWVQVSCARSPNADVWIDLADSHDAGSEFLLQVRRPLSGVGGTVVPEMRMPIQLAILGTQQVANAALACTAALLAGTSLQAVASAMESARPMHRRMQVLRDSDPMILDDTVGNAVSIHRLFDQVDRIPCRRLLVIYAVRGARGVAVNTAVGAALGARLRGREAILTITSSEDTAGPRDRVSAEERDAVLDQLNRSGTPFTYELLLQTSVRQTLSMAGAGDIVLLLGAQGMDAAGGIVREVLGLERRSTSRD